MLEPLRRKRVGNLSSGSVIVIIPLMSGVDIRSSSFMIGFSLSLWKRCLVAAKEAMAGSALYAWSWGRNGSL